MKKGYLFITILTIFLGIAIGIQIKNSYNNELELSFSDRQLVDELNKTKQENKKLLLKKEYFNSQIEILEKNRLKDEVTKELKEDVDELKMALGYKDVQGPGIIIRIDIQEDINLGFLMEEKNFLITLINQINVYGGEVISINEQRITPYSEVTLAGNHININSVPIAQPYEIKVIGNKERLNKYINDDNLLIDNMKNYNLNINIKARDKIIIIKAEREKKLKYTKTELNVEF
ncbi:DUF881 domain-containing protein [Tepidibacter formicigenes]|jgi:uncharacterized protein YlxW (UPF0749 family)|uniref:Uncharacterized conserved protein YlxW, UPF0749 family n=1 Tax=Tepidibacter formicigenes DSM 15518 TaxID=1123349 RepID=A0A1M6MGF8_9FIRM|nr:DUF881 domain-containing protein [Tepidibacter formicigenes]SHJ82534.1 Uncharacterized conserved protein YlxW, UPF0749 family [Tepidibacter formicigenes DSM 15518]